MHFIVCDWNPEFFLLILVALISIAQAAVEADSSSLQGSLFGQKMMQIFSGVCGWGELFCFYFFNHVFLVAAMQVKQIHSRSPQGSQSF